jgi:aldose sugar dehydrogenase
MMPLMPRGLAPLLAFVAAATAATAGAASAQPAMRSALHDVRVVPVAQGLVQPWSMAWLPNGDMLVTERPGRLRIVRDGKLLPGAVEGLPAIYTTGSQAGLFEVAVHPDFARNRFLYLTYAKPLDGGQSTSALIRARFENDRLTDVQPLFESVSKGRGHYGGKIAFDGKGFLYLTLGDRQVLPEGDEAALLKHPAQDLTNHHGKLIRLHDDGRVPADNPFVGTAGARPEIWSYGHRNVQGLAVHPTTGDLWADEHGPQGGDELNRIEKGKNYGWPVIGFGVNYTTGKAIHIGTMKEGMEQPAHVWVPSIGISGVLIYTGDRFPQWKGSLFIGGLVGMRLDRLALDGRTVTARETVAAGIGRVRDVRQGPDGFIYLAVEDRDGKPTAIHRLEPVERTTAR